MNTDVSQPGCGPQGRLSTRAIAMPTDTNPVGQIFGGWLMSQMDMAGAAHANHRVPGRIATVAVDAMTFLQPVFVGDEVTCYTEIVKIGHTSLAIRVEAWVRRHSGDEHQVKVTSATFTYVAVDDRHRKRPIPRTAS